jgi:Peptidase_C39 like family
MPKVTISANTFFKDQLLGSEVLSKSDKAFITKGQTLDVVEVSPDRNQHVYIKLATPILAQDGKTKIREVYAYAPHIKLEGEQTSQTLKLDVPYYSQLGNEEIFAAGEVWYDWRQCNTTSHTMMADFLLKGELTQKAKAEGLPEPESVYMRLVGQYGDTTNWDAQTQALEDLGIESYKSTTLSPKEVLKSLQAGIPIVAGVNYKASGHVVVIVGHDAAQKVWYIHDPYGTRHGYSNSYDIGVGGAFDVYTYDTMQQIYWDMGDENAWGRIVTKVKGKSTGLSENW